MLPSIARCLNRALSHIAKKQPALIFNTFKKNNPCLSVYFSRAYTTPKSHSDVRDLTKAEWAQRLTPEQFSVCREQCTEEEDYSHKEGSYSNHTICQPFSGEYNSWYEPGMYNCVCCGVELFSSEAKYDSRTGWPSYYQAYKNSTGHSNVIERPENSADLATFRTEVICKKCDSHLGHVFDDGPPPTGKRYCINSIALKFIPK